MFTELLAMDELTFFQYPLQKKSRLKKKKNVQAKIIAIRL